MVVIRCFGHTILGLQRQARTLVLGSLTLTARYSLQQLALWSAMLISLEMLLAPGLHP